jgi:predicted Zn-dependent protease
MAAIRREAKTVVSAEREETGVSFMVSFALAPVYAALILGRMNTRPPVSILVSSCGTPRQDLAGPWKRVAVSLQGGLLNGLFALALLALALPMVHARDETRSEGASASAISESSAEGIPVPRRSRVAGLASPEALERQGAQQYRQLLDQASAKRALAPADHPQRQRLLQIAKRLLPHTARFSPRAADWRWEVNLIGSNTINAFVMPGGKVVFYTGIIERLKLTDDEIAMIMGHEMAHALLEHGRERVGQERIAQAATIGASVISQALGYGDLGGLIAQGTSRLTLLSFNRGDETEADLVGMDIAARAGYDPRAAVTLWEKMSSASRGEPPQFLSTHPSNDTRIDTLRAALPRVLPLYERARNSR